MYIAGVLSSAMTDNAIPEKSLEKGIIAMADNTSPEIHHLVNTILKDLFYEIITIQERNVSLASKGKLTRTEMHMLETLGEGQADILSDVARVLSITAATASVSMNRLVSKGFVQRKLAKGDRRKYSLELTELGRQCYLNHKRFHEELVKSVIDEFEIEKFPDLLRALSSLNDFFREKKEHPIAEEE